MGKLEKLVENMAHLPQSLFLLTKLTNFYMQRNKFHRLMEDLVALTNEKKLQGTDKLKKSMEFCQKVVKYFLSFGFLTVFLLFLKSLLKFSLSDRQFPYSASFFFDLTKSPTFELVYLNACLGPIRNYFGTIGMDGLFLYIGFILVANFRNLQDQIEQKVKNRKELVKIVEYHTKLLECFETYAKIHFPTLIAQFLMIVLQICVLGFQMTRGKDLMKRIFSFTFFLVILSSQYLYNFTANKILVESEAVADAIYNVYAESKMNLRKDLRFMMMRAQKPLIVKAGFYKLTLNTFSKLLNSAISYMTLLKSLADD